MPKVLKLAMVSLGVLVLSSGVALAQTPPTTNNPTPTSSNQSKHKKSAKKSAHKKSAKKKSAKKTPPQ